MSDPTNPTPGSATPGPSQTTTVIDPLATPTIPPVTDRPAAHAQDPARSAGTGPHNPLDDVKPEPPRTHPVAYAALALAALALILSLFGLRDDDGGYRQVRIGNNDCIIGQQDDADVLFCRTPTVP